MLRRRVITALILASLALWLVWIAPRGLLPAVFAAIALWCAWEWAALAGFTGRLARSLCVAGQTGALAGAWWYLRQGLPALPLLVCSAVGWLALSGWLAAYARGLRRRPPAPVGVLIGLAIVSAAWFAIVTLHWYDRDGAWWVTLLFLVVWGSDVGGYFAGKAWGRRSLAPSISPGKTWAGVWGGLALALMGVLTLQLLGALLTSTPAASMATLLLALLVVLTVVFGMVGDLFESMIKRLHGVKDSGDLLPGHGGLLDRLDALFAAAPVLALGIQLGVRGPWSG